MTVWNGFKVVGDNIPLPRPGVYRFTCLANNKCYVGVSKNVAERCSKHGDKSPVKFKNAIRKYGKESFICEPVFYLYTALDLEYLFRVEAKIIEEFSAIKDGYNIRASSEPNTSHGEAFVATIKAGIARQGAERRSKSALAAHASRPIEQRIAIARKASAGLTPEQRKENIRVARESQTTQQLRDNARKGNAMLTPEQHSERSRKAAARQTPEQRSENARKAVASRTAEQRSESARKGNATRRARNAALQAVLEGVQ